MPLPPALNAFMDDLSEDWVEQPRQSSSSAPSSPSQSQLRSSTRRKSILSERSQNHSNIQANSVQRRRKSYGRSLSDASSAGGSVIAGGEGYDTTARKSVSVSPPKSRKLDSEPEWRRRLLQGQIGEQKDLFSPMAIENIFQKPPTAQRGSFRKVDEERKPKGLSFLKSFEQPTSQIPSSPPLWPQMSAPPSISASAMSKPPSRFGTVNTRQLSALDEEEEEESGMQQSEEGSVFQTEATKPAISIHKNTRVASNGSVIRNNNNDTVTSRKVSFGSVRLEPTSRKASDTASWNLTQNSDDFSPVFISKHNTADGRIAYAALDLSKSELEAKLAHLRESQHSRSRSASQSTKYTSNTGDESSLARLESEALPEDLPVGTPDAADVASIGEFVEFKRGGYSEIGSFKRRPLSPSPLRRPVSASGVDDSSMLPPRVTDMDFSGIPPAVPTPPAASAPKTPNTGRVGDFLSPQRTKSTGSPLKLFENHDTFTANRLQRRISQLEEPELDTIGEVRGSPARRATGDLSAVDEASFVEQPSFASLRGQDMGRRQSSIQQHFGQGDFDDYAFEEQQYSSIDGSELERDVPSRSVSPDMLPPGYQQPFRFHVEGPPSDFVDTFKSKRKPSRDSANGQLSIAKRSDRNRPTLSLLTETRMPSQPSQLSQVSEGKRPLTPSPFKSPTPKRRRTVVHHELAAGAEDEDPRMAITQESHATFQNALSRKRKDARHGSARNEADPSILAQRSILRPRNPTPSQRSRREHEPAREASLGAIRNELAQPPLPGESKESIETRVIASHLAVFTEDVAQRKKSVTTQDFLDDAMRVMQFIRTQYRPGTSGLTSVNEMTPVLHEGGDEGERLGYELSLDRPPSREGRPRSAWRTSKLDEGAVDARVVSHLRKFQEAEEDDAFLTASSRATHAANEIRREQHIETIESDPPGLTILPQSASTAARNDSYERERKLDSAGTDGSSNHTGKGHSSRTSIDSTLGRTTNSRKSASENVATLAPESVAHLIPEQVAGMTYDRELGRWVRRRSKNNGEARLDRSGMTGSDGDPFGDIPDLTVDSVEETRHLLLARSKGGEGIGVPAEGASALLDEFASRPATREGESVVYREHLCPPKAQGSLARMADTAVSGERETSDLLDMPAAEDEEVEHEISILDGRAQPTPPRPARSINVSLSSPVWTTTRGGNGLSPVLESPAVSVRDYGSRPPRATPSFKHQPGSNRQLSVSVRLNGTITTNASTEKDITQLAPSSSPCKSEITFHLSELPDFTLNQIDEREIPSRTLTKRNTVGPISHNGGMEDRYASGNHLLVKALQDAEPDEPYWEDLRRVDLKNRGLTSLHLLDVLCDRLEKLDVEGNDLAQLNGAPHTLRVLRARDNQLTGMTGWGHLFNLQYLDVSGNGIESLTGLAGLVHLRELKADGNQVRSLEGIEYLDGLLRLSLRANRIKEVAFEGCELQRLESLDLGGNALVAVRGLHCLPALKELILDGNNLTSFQQDDQTCPHLTILDLSDNNLTFLDLTTFAPNLRHLNLDKNAPASTTGIAQLQHLTILSLRSQSAPCDFTPLLTSRLPNLHSLALSENSITSLTIPHTWYSLRTLELASCGLQDLPTTFGENLPNLRRLNLNFNAVKDLRPLLNARGLRELHAAGNRLGRLRKTMAVLARLGELESVDLRENPFTIGFYPRAVEGTLVSTGMSRDVVAQDGIEKAEVGGGEEERMRFTLPPVDAEKDGEYLKRLDEGTRIRRRVYEMLVASECRGVRELDGLAFDREGTLVRDEVWERLVLLGVVRRSGKGGEVEVEVESP